MALAPRDIDAIHSLIERYADAVRRADWDAVTRLFTADAMRFPQQQAPIRGRTALRAWLQTFPPIQQFAITADEIIGCDDFAFVRGTYAMTLAPGAGQPPQTDRGHYMGVLRKQPDGSWLWSSDMAVSELSPER